MNKVQEELVNAHKQYVMQNGVEPKYTDVTIRFNGEDRTEDVVIKLNPSTEEEQNGEGDDNEIFFYCNGIDGLLDLCENDNGEDFVVVDFFGYFYNEL